MNHLSFSEEVIMLNHLYDLMRVTDTENAFGYPITKEILNEFLNNQVYLFSNHDALIESLGKFLYYYDETNIVYNKSYFKELIYLIFIYNIDILLFFIALISINYKNKKE